MVVSSGVTASGCQHEQNLALGVPLGRNVLALGTLGAHEQPWRW